MNSLLINWSCILIDISSQKSIFCFIAGVHKLDATAGYRIHFQDIVGVPPSSSVVEGFVGGIPPFSRRVAPLVLYKISAKIVMFKAVSLQIFKDLLC